MLNLKIRHNISGFYFFFPSDFSKKNIAIAVKEFSLSRILITSEIFPC